jgi:hypothetical protein
VTANSYIFFTELETDPRANSKLVAATRGSVARTISRARRETVSIDEGALGHNRRGEASSEYDSRTEENDLRGAKLIDEAASFPVAA